MRICGAWDSPIGARQSRRPRRSARPPPGFLIRSPSQVPLYFVGIKPPKIERSFTPCIGDRNRQGHFPPPSAPPPSGTLHGPPPTRISSIRQLALFHLPALLSVELFREIRHRFRNFDLLGTYRFAAAAADTGAGTFLFRNSHHRHRRDEPAFGKTMLVI